MNRDRGAEAQTLVTALRGQIDAAHALRHFPTCMRSAIAGRIWRRSRSSDMVASIEPMSVTDFVHRPWPWGLGTDFATIDRLLRDDVEALTMWRAIVDDAGL